MVEQNKQIAKRWLLEFWSGDMSLAHELHAPDYFRHDSPFPIENPDAYVKFILIFLKAMPDMTFMLQDMVGEENTIVVRWTGKGTHEGELYGVQGTGKTLNFRGTDWLKFKDGKIVESWGFYDALGLMQQIGAIPGK